jgi:hypothetical protein
VRFATLGVAPDGAGVDAQVVDGADVGGAEVDEPVGVGQAGQVGTEPVGDVDPVANVDGAVDPVGLAVVLVLVVPALVRALGADVVGQVPPDPVGVGLPVGVADVVGVVVVGPEVELDGVVVGGNVVVGTVVVGNVTVGNVVVGNVVVGDFAVVEGFAVLAVTDVVDEAGFGLEIGTSGTLFSGRPCW